MADNAFFVGVLGQVLRFTPGLALVGANRKLHPARLGLAFAIPGVPGMDEPSVLERRQGAGINRQLRDRLEGNRLAPRLPGVAGTTLAQVLEIGLAEDDD